MRLCWKYHSLERPSFEDLVEILGKVLSKTTNKEYIDFEQPQLKLSNTSQESSSALQNLSSETVKTSKQETSKPETSITYEKSSSILPQTENQTGVTNPLYFID